MSRIWIEPNFRPGMNILDALTAARLNEVVRAINQARPLGSDTILASPTSAGTILSTKSGPNAPHPFAIRVTRDGASETEGKHRWLLYVCPGTVYFTSSDDKRRFGFKVVDAEAEEATQEVPADANDYWELYVKLKFADGGPTQATAFEEHLAGFGGKHCVRVLEGVSFHWHKVPDNKKGDENEGLSKKDKSDTRYYYIGRVRFSGDTYAVDQRRRSDIDICDPCEDPGSSSASSASDSGSGDGDPGVYVVTDINCNMEPTSGGGCCVTLTMTKQFMAVPPRDQYVDVKECCEG